jgi:hypothetical protein
VSKTPNSKWHSLGDFLAAKEEKKRAEESTAPPSGVANKVKNINESNKGELSAAPDYQKCPDCQGSGSWYLEGSEKGVAKCKHQRLKDEE